MLGRSLLDTGRAYFTRFGRAFSGLLASCLLGLGTYTTPASGFLTAAALFVDGLPCAFLREAFRSTPLFIAFFDMLGLAFLFVSIF